VTKSANTITSSPRVSQARTDLYGRSENDLRLRDEELRHAGSEGCRALDRRGVRLASTGEGVAPYPGTPVNPRPASRALVTPFWLLIKK